jgi:hypothetical protein
MCLSEKVSRAENSDVGGLAVASFLRGATTVRRQRSTCLEVDRGPMRNAAIYESVVGVRKGREKGDNVHPRAIHRVHRSLIVVSAIPDDLLRACRH